MGEENIHEKIFSNKNKKKGKEEMQHFEKNNTQAHLGLIVYFKKCIASSHYDHDHFSENYILCIYL